MKKRTAIFGTALLLLLTGCRSGSDDKEIELLKEQISQLEQQITTMEQQNAATEQQNSAMEQQSSVMEQQAPTAQQQNTIADNNTQTQPPAASSDQSGQTTLSTTNTMEELTAMVDAYVEKANTVIGTASGDIEQFFSLKQEEKQIDNALDLHEDELEKLYRQNALTRDEYKSLERELEKLEDRLDDAEDQLEYTFGIDD